MPLPNPNPDGTASIAMMQLSFQETSTNYLQGIFEGIQSLKTIMTSMRVFDDRRADVDDRTAAQQRRRDEETRRESLLGRAGGGLKQAAASVKSTGSNIAKGFSLQKMISTILAAGVLTAIFAPEIYEKLEKEVKTRATAIMNNEWVKGMLDTGFEIFKKNFEVDNLLISAIFGFRAGALYSAGEYFGEKIGAWGVDFFNKMIRGLADSLGMETEEALHVFEGEAYTKKTNFISEETKQSIIDNMGTIFAVGGLAAILMPGLFIGIAKMMGAVGWWIGKKIFTSMFAGAAIDLAGEVIPDADQEALRRSGRQLRGSMRNTLGRIVRIASRGLLVVGGLLAAYEVAQTYVDFFEKFDTKKGLGQLESKAEQRVRRMFRDDATGGISATGSTVEEDKVALIARMKEIASDKTLNEEGKNKAYAAESKKYNLRLRESVGEDLQDIGPRFTAVDTARNVIDAKETPGSIEYMENVNSLLAERADLKKNIMRTQSLQKPGDPPLTGDLEKELKAIEQTLSKLGVKNLDMTPYDVTGVERPDQEYTRDKSAAGVKQESYETAGKEQGNRARFKRSIVTRPYGLDAGFESPAMSWKDIQNTAQQASLAKIQSEAMPAGKLRSLFGSSVTLDTPIKDAEFYQTLIATMSAMTQALIMNSSGGDSPMAGGTVTNNYNNNSAVSSSDNINFQLTEFTPLSQRRNMAGG
mgnify:FL=1